MERDIALFFGKPSDKAIINPIDYIEHMKELKGLNHFKFPNYCILCFFKKLYKEIKKKYKPKIIKYNEEYPIYIFRYKGIEIAFVYPTMGSYASTVLEEMIALGGKYFIFFGGVGIISSAIERGEIILPIKAIRDEGTSFHYQKPSKYSYPSKLILKFIKKTLKQNKVSFHEGVTWTTDAPYRETRRKVLKFRKEGALCVEMEASAFFSVGKFRKVDIAGLFIAGDCIAGGTWNPRRKRKDILKIETERKKLLDYALETFYLLNNSSCDPERLDLI